MVVMGHLQELLSLSPMYTGGIHVIKLLLSLLLIFYFRGCLSQEPRREEEK